MSKDVQAPTYKLVYDRFVGNKKLHDRVYIVCAGNKLTDKAIAQTLSTALKSRIITFNIEHDFKEFMEWAAADSKTNPKETNIHVKIRAYLTYVPTDLMVFDPASDDHTFRCPRTWEFLSKYLYADPQGKATHARIQGTIGTAGMANFVTFMNEFEDLPKIQDIMDNPLGTPVPPRPATKYAVTTILVDHARKPEDLKIVIEYIKRFDAEFQIVFCRSYMSKYPAMRSNPIITSYAFQFMKDL